MQSETLREQKQEKNGGCVVKSIVLNLSTCKDNILGVIGRGLGQK